ncbi:hypothetical protein LUZ63_003388 [Rhynchospora breviuscula]|uniref:Uncharacterized protein n=1 Tax=Rhynchospora breviuscula TaxID=2022672 RepID=A0A9Q0D1X9_9POAL|nr:hypothetical protein LUZ63_003388 [Rhynchospora breviuscula]
METEARGDEAQPEVVLGKDREKGKRRKAKKEQKSKKCRLLRYDELPDYMKENEFILNYYRCEWPLTKAFFSLFSWHNETINIWTHLLGFLLFLILTVLHLSYYIPQVADFLGHISGSIATSAVENVSANFGNFFVGAASLVKLDASIGAHSSATTDLSAQRWPFFVFLAGSMFCLLCSSLCHLLCCHSHRLNLFLIRLDYVGIAVMIVTSFFPPIYYIFQCDPQWQIVYLSAISAFGLVTIYTLLNPHLSTARFRAYRTLLFVGMGFSGIVPAVHATIVNWHEPQRNLTLAYEAAMALSYLTGTIFYATRVPERWKPGAFDLAGHSHQIFHVFVIFGAVAHYGAAVIFLGIRDKMGCNVH